MDVNSERLIYFLPVRECHQCRGLRFRDKALAGRGQAAGFIHPEWGCEWIISLPTACDGNTNRKETKSIPESTLVKVQCLWWPRGFLPRDVGITHPSFWHLVDRRKARAWVPKTQSRYPSVKDEADTSESGKDRF